jgi:hypothetical protein
LQQPCHRAVLVRSLAVTTSFTLVGNALGLFRLREVLNMRMPGFSAEASLYRPRSYRERRVDGVMAACETVEAAANLEIEPADVYFETPWDTCACWFSDNSCHCTPKKRRFLA